MVSKKKTMAKNDAKNTPLCEWHHILLSCVCFWIVIGFTKYFYADFSGCDRHQDGEARHVKLKNHF